MAEAKTLRLRLGTFTGRMPVLRGSKLPGGLLILARPVVNYAETPAISASGNAATATFVDEADLQVLSGRGQWRCQRSHVDRNAARLEEAVAAPAAVAAEVGMIQSGSDPRLALKSLQGHSIGGLLQPLKNPRILGNTHALSPARARSARRLLP